MKNQLFFTPNNPRFKAARPNDSVKRVGLSLSFILTSHLTFYSIKTGSL